MPSLYEFYVIFSVFAILNARFFYHVGIYNFVRAINISGRALTSSNVHLDFQLTSVKNQHTDSSIVPFDLVFFVSFIKFSPYVLYLLLQLLNVTFYILLPYFKDAIIVMNKSYSLKTSLIYRSNTYEYQRQGEKL